MHNSRGLFSFPSPKALVSLSCRCFKDLRIVTPILFELGQLPLGKNAISEHGRETEVIKGGLKSLIISSLIKATGKGQAERATFSIRSDKQLGVEEGLNVIDVFMVAL